MNNDQTQLLAKFTELSEDEKFELFSVEELENRLEMAATADTLTETVIDCMCWVAS
ncbi:hypothetical protein [Hymenobacter cellulosivorans]|uniref:Bacteriocin n=1 Tax=Hymenobacter cellulosivorans TaxID=2932249 RepID=A0ABY4FBG6_9BACT|nr:hypothetical protein [Hymenobacter cellulosivorans]UOQ53765.1 hypothetical protein MUN80_03155 [Hymenobacter cellulosivorans]